MHSSIMEKMVLFGFLIQLIALTEVSGGQVKFVDNMEYEEMMNYVCDEMVYRHGQIRDISTIEKILYYIIDLEPKDKDNGWQYKICHPLLNSIELLYKVVDESSSDVCSDEKLSLIEQFHHRFVSSATNIKEIPAPRLLVRFFIHYVYQISKACKAKLLERIDGYESKIDLHKSNIIPERVESFLKKVSMTMGLDYNSSPIYSEVFLVWANKLDKSLRKKQNNGDHEITSLVAYKTKDPEVFRSFKRECLLNLRIYYSPLALPVIKLINLGYYLDNEPFAVEYAKSEKLRNLLALTKACEFVAPMRVVKDDTMDQSMMKKISNEEADELLKKEEPDYRNVEPVQVEDVYCSLDNLESLPTASSPTAAQNFINTIKPNIKARDRVMIKRLRAMGRNLKNKVKSLAGKLFSNRKNKSKSNDDDETEVDVEGPLDNLD